MKILHVFDHSLPLSTGYTFRSREIIKHQRQLGWQTAHLTTARQNAASQPTETVDGLTFYRTPKPTSPLASVPGLWPLAEMKATERRLAEVTAIERPDVIHAHSPALNAWPALRVARRIGVPIVYEIRAFWEDAAVDHGTTAEESLRYRMGRALETGALRRVDAVVTICEGLRTEIVGRGIDPARVRVVANAVDTARFAYSPYTDDAFKRSLGLSGGPVVGFLGSFYGYEGLGLLLRAMPILRAQVPGAQALLVGGGPEDARLRQAAADAGLGDAVVFTGRVPNAEVDRYYDAIDVLAFPRLPMRLTDLVTPLKPLEAMARGKAVVASDVGGHRELVRDGDTGLLHRAGDAQALADKLAQLLQDAQLRDRIQRNGRTFVENERTWSRSVMTYRDVFAMVRQAPVDQ